MITEIEGDSARKLLRQIVGYAPALQACTVTLSRGLRYTFTKVKFSGKVLEDPTEVLKPRPKETGKVELDFALEPLSAIGRGTAGAAGELAKLLAVEVEALGCDKDTVLVVRDKLELSGSGNATILKLWRQARRIP